MNSEQQRAIETVHGRVLILAGAGSGKTRVLTHRIVHLVENLKVSPKAILGLTFTNKAAVEMRERMNGLMDPCLAREVTLSTFHSFCLQILRCDIQRLGYTSNFSLYSEHDVKRLMNYITRDILNHQGDLPSFGQAEALIQQAKAKGLRPQEIFDPSSSWHENYARTLFCRLEEAMRAYNAVDFDHLLTLSVKLFEEHPDLLEKYQERYRYLMVDEYQDTNPIQYRLIELLSKKYNHLCVVGDDDQSIYGWRGAEVKNILNFDRATLIRLEQNYRSTNTILQVANSVISRNKERHEKVLWSQCGEGEPVEVLLAATEQEEANHVVSQLVKLRETEKLAWGDIAILYRSNTLSRCFEIALSKQGWHDGNTWKIGVPYKIHGGTEFYEKREIKDLLAYLRVLINLRDEEALLRIINQPRRGIGESFLDGLTAYSRKQRVALWTVIIDCCAGCLDLQELTTNLHKKSLLALRDFVGIIEESVDRFSQNPLGEAMQWLIGRIGYKKAIYEEVKSTQMRDFKWRNVQDLVQLMTNFEGESSSPLADFVTSFPLDSQFRVDEGLPQDKVQLMTFHSAKGLEFLACYLVGIEDNIIPHEKSLKETGVEEERRLMYVAITRAKKYLTMSMAAKRMRMGKEEIGRPSRFLEDVPNHLMKKKNLIF